MLLGLVLAGCQPLPQPFQPEDKDDIVSDLLRPVGEVSLFVLPVANAPDQLAQDLAQRLATALLEQDVPASITARAAISSDLVTALVTDEAGQLAWAWQVARARQAPLNGPAYPLGQPLGRLETLTPRQFDGLARGLAQVVAQRLAAEGASPQAGAATPPELPRFHLLPFEGAPGDGNASLAEALRRLVAGSGIGRVVSDTSQADYLIDCSIRLTDAGPNTQQVALTWSLYSPDGTRLGNITQSNRVPRGSLDRAWGPISQAAAEGGMEGLRQILARLRR